MGCRNSPTGKRGKRPQEWEPRSCPTSPTWKRIQAWKYLWSEMRQWAIVLTPQLFEGIVNRKQLLYNSASALRSHQCSESPMCRKTILELEIRATRHCLVPMTILSGSHEATSRLFWASFTLPWLRLFSKDCVFYFFWHGASQELINPSSWKLSKIQGFSIWITKSLNIFFRFTIPNMSLM